MFLFEKKITPNLQTLRAEFQKQVTKLSVALSQEDERRLWDALEAKAKEISFVPRGNIPLLVVVNGDRAEELKKINAHTKLDLNNIAKDSAEADNYYLLLDVDDGRKAVAKSPDESLVRFKKQQRFPFTLQESLALLKQYPEVLQDHYLTVCGSFYKKDANEQPLLWLLDDDKKPELHYAWHHIAHGSYGAASSAIKITP